MIMRHTKLRINPTIWALSAIGLLGLFSFAGCQSRPPLEELGELEFAVPDIPGIDDPYPLPDVAGSAEKPADSEQSDDEP